MIIFLLVFILLVLPASADELENYNYGLPISADELGEYKRWLASLNYTIPEKKRCRDDFPGPNCPPLPPIPAEERQQFQYLTGWDVTITACVIRQNSHLCVVGIFDSHRGKIDEYLIFNEARYILNSCIVVEQKPCEIEGFVACITSKFSSKFPLDIFLNLPSTQITYPKVNFFGKEFDLCFIYEAMRLMKYPIAAALVVKLFLYL
ncbi:MAG: hypothetical protein ICV54_01350 [Nostoc sp. C3-bin3]|nr:hypothetical protein [Nostoc sp. C3-bin3]